MHSAPLQRRLSALLVALALVAAGCASGIESETVTSSAAASDEPVAVSTTPPLALPIATAAPTPTDPPPALPTIAPPPTATSVPVEATAVPAPPEPAATAAPAAPAATAAPAPQATAAPQPTAVPEPTLEPTATPAPESASAPIFLGDFEVVNLATGANQNIAELAPTGTTLLWFWAPH